MTSCQLTEALALAMDPLVNRFLAKTTQIDELKTICIAFFEIRINVCDIE
jgi:hypothetical protein